MPAKNIVVCCDGTGNEYGTENSNVVKLYSTLMVNEEQVAYYHPGVGTMGSATARNRFQEGWDRLKGLAFGYGLLDNISDAYRYLMDTYADGDQIYLFGFSRGAYTVRALGGLLRMFGLLCRGNDGLIPYILRMYAQRTRSAAGMSRTFEMAEGFKDTYSRDVLLHFVGVWDTVNSVGWVWDPIRLPYTACNPIMKNGRHAVSIDERRCYYRDNLWGEPFTPENKEYRVPQDVKQVWFAGVHSDVGGSYPEGESGLSKVTLEWMLGEAAGKGLKLDMGRVDLVLGRTSPMWFVPPDPADGEHQSLQGPWWITEVLPHRRYLKTKGKPGWVWHPGLRRHVPEGAVVHQSVIQRMQHVEGYRPANLTPGYSIEPAVRFACAPVAEAQQRDERLFEELTDAEKVQAVRSFKLDAEPLLDSPPKAPVKFMLLSAVVAALALLRAGLHLWPAAALVIAVMAALAKITADKQKSANAALSRAWEEARKSSAYDAHKEGILKHRKGRAAAGSGGTTGGALYA
jgi:hypothetical protein